MVIQPQPNWNYQFSMAISAFLGTEMIQVVEAFICFLRYSYLEVGILTITVRKLLSLALYKVLTLVWNPENLLSIHLSSFWSTLTHIGSERM